MLGQLISVLQQSVVVTSFVATMMLLVEFVNVRTTGMWRRQLQRRRWTQHLVAAALGAIPGCLGVFTAVTVYTHGSLSLGALVAAAVASCGDEAFVMLALFPGTALWIFVLLAILGIVVGITVDALLLRRTTANPSECLQIHVPEDIASLSWPQLAAQWREYSAARGSLSIGLLLFLTAILTGGAAAEGPLWLRALLLGTVGFALYVVATAPDHFLEQHVWRHVLRKHVPRVFFWTTGALLAMAWIPALIPSNHFLQANAWAALIVACLLGLLPESGPHLLFVTLYAQGAIPLSVLLASCVVQDGHGLLPLLAHSRQEFVVIKGINLIVGIATGALLLAAGY